MGNFCGDSGWHRRAEHHDVLHHRCPGGDDDGTRRQPHRQALGRRRARGPGPQTTFSFRTMHLLGREALANVKQISPSSLRSRPTRRSRASRTPSSASSGGRTRALPFAATATTCRGAGVEPTGTRGRCAWGRHAAAERRLERRREFESRDHSLVEGGSATVRSRERHADAGAEGGGQQHAPLAAGAGGHAGRARRGSASANAAGG